MELKDRPKLLSLFNIAVNRAVKSAVKEGQPLTMSKKDTYVGPLLVQKLINGTYSIYKTNANQPMYSDIHLYEAAVLISQHYERGAISCVREILKIDSDYAKYKTDMMHYIACYKHVKESKDIERMLVLEDKFCMAEELSKITRQRLSKFKISR